MESSERSQIDPASSPDIAVVVPTYCRPEGVRRLVSALASQTLSRDRWELIVVDDGSGSPMARLIDEIVAAAPFAAKVLFIEKNRGPAAVRNLGWKSSQAPFLAFTDDDCQPQPGWLAAGIAALASSSRVGVVQGRTTRPSASSAHPYTRLTVIREVLAPSPWFEGCNLFFRREALEDGGGFDESLGYFGEETSLAWSALDAGWERAWAHDALVEHELTERPWRWHVRIHFLERNTVRLAARYPAMRSLFWRPWAVKREGAFFALAVLGLLSGVRWRPALLLTIPYIRWLPPPWREGVGWKAVLQQASLHAVSLSGKLAVGIQERTFLL